MELFDTHAHLDEEQLLPRLDEIILRAREAGVVSLVAVGTTAESSRQCVQIAHQHGIYAAVGLQPNYCSEVSSRDWGQVVKLASDPRVVALGETGLDRYWDYSPFEIQEDFFDRHLQASQSMDLPFIVHMRDCGVDILRMLSQARRRGPLCGVMHSFTGDVELMRACVELGLYISFAGMITFKKSDDLRDVAAAVPDDRLLIETDAPYLSPHPKRAQRPNEPSLLVHTAACLAEQRGLRLPEFAAMTTANAKRLFRVAETGD